MRKLATGAGARSVVLFSLDSASDLGPQVFTSALCAIGKPCFRLDGSSSRLEPITKLEAVQSAVLLPFNVLWSLARAWSTAVRASRAKPAPAVHRPVTVSEGDAVLFLWPIRRERQVGGAVTHAAGILRGFKDCGLKVGLVARSSPPPQLEGLFDYLELADPLPAVDRCLPYTEMIAANRSVVAAGRRLAERIGPTFLYQRHSAYTYAGSELADELGVPLVLEVNGPAMWTRFNWRDQAPGEKKFLNLGKELERRSVDTALVSAAVSRNAAEGTLEECGAAGGGMLISPNAVDFDAVRQLAEDPLQRPPDGQVRLGWVGSFGPWHGASYLIEAMPLLPEHVVALMIGTGGEFEDCRRRVVELGLEDRVTMPGALSHSDAVKALASCDMLVSPHVAASDTPFFGSPTKLFEFMAIGLPIVASDLEQIGEILRDGKTAALVEPGNIEDLVRGINHVLALPDRGKSLGEEAMFEAREMHTWRRRAEDMIAALAKG
jgi:glycosyltransferase involved in cell wall biosynthesis